MDTMNNAILKIEEDTIQKVSPMAWQTLTVFMDEYDIDMDHLAEVIEYDASLGDLWGPFDDLPEHAEEVLVDLYDKLLDDFRAMTGLSIGIMRATQEQYAFGVNIFELYEPNQKYKRLKKEYNVIETIFIPDDEEYGDLITIV